MHTRWKSGYIQRTLAGLALGARGGRASRVVGGALVGVAVATQVGLTLDGRIVFTGEQYVDAANATALDSWTRVDIGARYTLDVADQALTLRARIENLTDEAYWASTGGYPGANYLILGNPRTFMMSASIDF